MNVHLTTLYVTTLHVTTNYSFRIHAIEGFENMVASSAMVGFSACIIKLKNRNNKLGTRIRRRVDFLF